MKLPIPKQPNESVKIQLMNFHKHGLSLEKMVRLLGKTTVDDDRLARFSSLTSALRSAKQKRK